jgi:hypothetical protein
MDHPDLIQIIAQVVKEMKATETVQVAQSQVFRSGTYVLTVEKVTVIDHTSKSGTTNKWVRFVCKMDGYNRPVFADITLTGKSLDVVSQLSVELTGKSLNSKSNYSNFLESLVGMVVTATVSQKIIGEGKNVLKTFIGSWKAV